VYRFVYVRSMQTLFIQCVSLISVNSIVQEIKLVHWMFQLNFCHYSFMRRRFLSPETIHTARYFVVFLSPSRQLLIEWDAAASFPFVSHLQTPCHSFLCMTCSYESNE
jgi:hypothetical protein